MIKYIIFVSFLLLSWQADYIYAQEQKSAFVRINKDQSGNYLSFDTLIAHYKKGGVNVDLIAAVHVAEKEYFQKFNQDFTRYDALLYELIAEPGIDIKAAGESKDKNILTLLQESLKNILGLEFQLEYIDYKKSNFVHADMTPEDFQQSMKKKNESVWSLLLKVLLNSQEIAEKNQTNMAPEIFMLQMLLSPNKQMTIRRIIANQFQDIDSFLKVFEGDQGTTIITERNKVAIKTLKQQIASGKKSLAIFYGAGHMPDMEKSLFKEGFSKQGQDWIIAWKLN